MALIPTKYKVGDIIKDDGWVGIIFEVDDKGCILRYTGMGFPQNRVKDFVLGCHKDTDIPDKENSLFTGEVIGNLKDLMVRIQEKAT